MSMSKDDKIVAIGEFGVALFPDRDRAVAVFVSGTEADPIGGMSANVSDDIALEMVAAWVKAINAERQEKEDNREDDLDRS